MAADKKSNAQILRELEALSDTLFRSRLRAGKRRTASFDFPRTDAPPPNLAADEAAADKENASLSSRPRSRRMSLSLSSWPSKPNVESKAIEENKALRDDQSAATSGKKGIWKWKPIRALAHLGKQKLSCMFSVEVIAVKGLPASMNGLRLAVRIRKKESKDGFVQSMPARVSQGTANFDETLFMGCHVYVSPGSRSNMKFEPRPFQIQVLGVDVVELDFGKNYVDLSSLIQESVEQSQEGRRIRQWDQTFGLSGKAKGGELVLKIGFQIMEKDGGIAIYGQAEEQKLEKSRSYSTSVARKPLRSLFSSPSSRMSSGAEATTLQKQMASSSDKLDSQPEANMDENDLPDFDVVDKGVEVVAKNGEREEEQCYQRVVAGEVVKEVVQDQTRVTRLKELSSIAEQIKALETIMSDDKKLKTNEEHGSQTLDEEEDKVTRQFLQMLDDPSSEKELKISGNGKVHDQKPENNHDEEQVYVPELGKGLGCVVQTRDGGYLAAVNPFETPVARKDEPKLAIQMSKPLVIQSNKAGFELLQKLAAIGFEELTSEVSTSMPMDDLMGKTAEQVAFEGIASAVIHGRKKEGASSSAARIIAAVKSMATAMNSGRKERTSSGIWNVSEDPMTVDEILAFSMHKMEAMAIDALKIQADIAEEAAPFDISPLDSKITAADGKVYSHPLASAIPIEDWIKANGTKRSDYCFETEGVTISVVIQLRDPLRQYEPIGGPMIALIHANHSNSGTEEKMYNLASLQVGGVKVRTLRTKNVWDAEKQKLTALQWLVANGMGKGGKKVKVFVPTEPDLLWSISARVVADMWLKPVRNPDVKFTK